jgi:hypothetical protein
MEQVSIPGIQIESEWIREGREVIIVCISCLIMALWRISFAGGEAQFS